MDSSFDKVTKSRLYELGENLWDIIALSVLWILFSIPVITSAASSAALYYAVNRRYRKISDAPVKDFFRSFKSNLIQGIPLSLLVTLFGGFIIFNIRAARYGFGDLLLPEWYLPLAIIMFIPYTIIYPFESPYLARFKSDTKTTVMHACTFSLMNPGKAICLTLLMFISMFLMIIFPPCLLILPFASAYLRVYICEKIFDRAIEDESRRNEDSVNGSDEVSDTKEDEDA